MTDSESLRTEVAKCNRCGYCQETCPVFAATGVESSVARGRIALLRRVLEGRAELSEEMDNPLFECLLCRGCVSVCAAGAETDRIIAEARAAWRRKHGSSAAWNVARETLLDRGALVRAARLAFTASRLGLPRLARATGLLRLFPPGLQVAADLVPRPPARFLTDLWPELELTPTDATRRVGYFVSCGMNLVQPGAAADSVRSLAALGCAVEPLDNCCCGLPAHVSGETETARLAAEKNLLALEAHPDLESVVTDCASCSSHLRRMPELVSPELRERAERVAARVVDYTEIVGQAAWPTSLRPVARRVTFHDPCHLARHQDLAQWPRAILRAIPGLDYVELPEADWCCGGAGTYSAAHAEIAGNVLARKWGHVQSTEADTLVTACPSCMIQLDYGARRAGSRTRVRHIASLVAETLGC